MAGHHHQHKHQHHDHIDLAGQRESALKWSLVLNGGFLGVEVVGGIVFSSLALLADAAHMSSDVAGLVIALWAQRALKRPSSERHTYGLQRSEVLAAALNAATLLAAVVWIVLEAFDRFQNPAPVEAIGVAIVAAIGLAINLASAWMLARTVGRSLNMRGAYLHMAFDAAGSVVVLLSAVVAAISDVLWVDPVASLIVAAMVLWGAWGLLRQALGVLMEAAPEDLDLKQLSTTLEAEPGVVSVHHLHVWNLASDVTALSAHVILEEGRSLHDAQLKGNELRTLLHDKFGIDHATLELECHPCD